MKLIGNVEVSGLRHVVFDRTTIYEYIEADGMWFRETSPRNKKMDIGYISNQRMAYNLSNICKTDGYRVRIDGNTANVYSEKKQIEEMLSAKNLSDEKHEKKVVVTTGEDETDVIYVPLSVLVSALNR
jgi:hypothetical protein